RRRPTASAARHCKRGATATVVHYDQHRLRFALGQEVIHDVIRAPLYGPGGFVLARAVLEIEHGITRARIFVVAWRSIDEAAAPGFAHGREILMFADLAVRNVLRGKKILIVRGHFDAAHPAAGAEE